MGMINQRIIEWAGRWTRAELAALAASVLVIVVVPGGLMAWLAFRFLRARAAS